MDDKTRMFWTRFSGIISVLAVVVEFIFIFKFPHNESYNIVVYFSGFVAVVAIIVCCVLIDICRLKKFEYQNKVDYWLPKYFDKQNNKYEVQSIFYVSGTNQKLIVGKYKFDKKDLYCGIWLKEDCSYHPNGWFYLPETLQTREDFDELVKSFKLKM